ncbi:MAG: hypothetical protein COA79_16155 [Planctomycetota bacterium]|nr:MAG: hypothetical protein COA79_16155 [Planctomycetota bacterium]
MNQNLEILHVDENKIPKEINNGKNNMNTLMIDKFKNIINEESLHFHVSNIFGSDRKSNFKAYNFTANWIKNQLVDYGLDDVELQHIPADGKSLLSDWITPLAWDVNEATLDVVFENGENKRICDYAKLADSIIMGSKATGANGLDTTIVDIDLLDLRKDRIDGCIALTERKACDMKRVVFEAGGVGVISYFHPFPNEDQDSLFWNNCWSDRKGGWWQISSDCQILGFSISPNQGCELKKILSRGEIIQAHAKVDSKLYEGSLPFITGRIKGSSESKEEILVLSHLYEHGAHDNATGSATNLEIARAIAAGIDSGELERPERSLRFLFMAECYGTIAYAQYRQERMKKTKAAISLDGVGAKWPLNVHREADCSRSPLGPALAAVANEIYEGDQDAVVNIATVEVSDTLLSDPAIGVPTAWPHRGCKDDTWHTSLDTLDKIEPKVMKEMAIIVATTLLRFASLKVKDASYLAQLCMNQGLVNLNNKKNGIAVTETNQFILEHEKNAELNAIEMIKIFAFKNNEEDVSKEIDSLKKTFISNCDKIIKMTKDDLVIIDDVKSLFEDNEEFDKKSIFSRTLTGHISLDPLSEEDFVEAKISPRWSPWQVAGFWWIDGNRDLEEIYKNMYGEFQITLKALTKYYGVLQKHGYIKVIN